MPTDAEQIATIKSQALERLVEITAVPKPSYYVDGQQISWTAYHKMLSDQVVAMNKLLVDEDLSSNGPYEISSRGIS